MQWCAGYPDTAPTTTVGVARGGTWPWSPKYINSIMCPPFCQFFKKVVLRLSEHGDTIETQTIMVCLPQKFLANCVPVPVCPSRQWLKLETSCTKGTNSTITCGVLSKLKPYKPICSKMFLLLIIPCFKCSHLSSHKLQNKNLKLIRRTIHTSLMEESF